MKKNQLRAIWYTERKRQLARQEKWLRENNLLEEFKKSKYKTMTWFIRSTGNNVM